MISTGSISERPDRGLRDTGTVDAAAEERAVLRFYVVGALVVAGALVQSPDELTPRLLRRRIDHTTTKTYAELFDWLEPDELLHGPPSSWVDDWEGADPDRF